MDEKGFEQAPRSYSIPPVDTIRAQEDAHESDQVAAAVAEAEPLLEQGQSHPRPDASHEQDGEFTEVVARYAAAGNQLARVALVSMIRATETQPPTSVPGSAAGQKKDSTAQPLEGAQSADKEQARLMQRLRGLNVHDADFEITEAKLLEVGSDESFLEGIMTWDGSEEGLSKSIALLSKRAEEVRQDAATLTAELPDTRQGLKDAELELREQALEKSRKLSAKADELETAAAMMEARSQELLKISRESSSDISRVAQRAILYPVNGKEAATHPLTGINPFVAETEIGPSESEEGSETEQPSRFKRIGRKIVQLSLRSGRAIKKADKAGGVILNEASDWLHDKRRRYVASIVRGYREGVEDDSSQGKIQTKINKIARGAGETLSKERRNMRKDSKGQSGFVIYGKDGKKQHETGKAAPARNYPARPSKQRIAPLDRARVKPARTKIGKKWQEQQEKNRKGVV